MLQDKERTFLCAEHLLMHLTNCIYRLYNPQPHQTEKDFFKCKEQYLQYQKIWKEEFPELGHSDFSLCFMITESDFQKLRSRYKLSNEIPWKEKVGKETHINYGHLASWSKKGKKDIINLVLQAEGINPHKMFPPSLLSRFSTYLKKKFK